jgi:hypothetical protein
MSYTLHFSSGDAESYDNLDSEQLDIVLLDEIAQAIRDMGSDGYDPTAVLETLNIELTDENDPDGRLWQAACEFDIMRRARLFYNDVIKDLMRGSKRYLPDNSMRIWITREQS